MESQWENRACLCLRSPSWASAAIIAKRQLDCRVPRRWAETRSPTVSRNGSSHLQFGDPEIFEIQSKGPVNLLGWSRAIHTEASAPTGDLATSGFQDCLVGGVSSCAPPPKPCPCHTACFKKKKGRGRRSALERRLGKKSSSSWRLRRLFRWEQRATFPFGEPLLHLQLKKLAGM